MKDKLLYVVGGLVIVGLFVSLFVLGGKVSSVNDKVNLLAGGSGETMLGGTTNFDALELGGDLSVAGAFSATGALTASGSATVTGIIYGDMYSTSTDAYAFALGANQVPAVVFHTTTGSTTTLPAVTNTGARVIVSILTAFDTSDSVVESAEGDNINGSLFVNDAIVACSGEDKIKFIADGEEIGDFVEFLSDGTNWNIINSRGETAAKITCTDPN